MKKWWYFFRSICNCNPILVYKWHIYRPKKVSVIAFMQTDKTDFGLYFFGRATYWIHLIDCFEKEKNVVTIFFEDFFNSFFPSNIRTNRSLMTLQVMFESAYFMSTVINWYMYQFCLKDTSVAFYLKSIEKLTLALQWSCLSRNELEFKSEWIAREKV